MLSGWAKGDSVPIKDNRQFAIIGTFNYTDGGTETFTVPFNPDADSSINWQYSSTAMVADRAYSSVTVTLAYDYNVNMVYFDGIQLFKEAFGTSYTYDGNGNITTVKDIQGGTTAYTYNTTHDVTGITLPDNTVTTYTYDSANQLIRENDPAAGTTMLWSYDDAGNVTRLPLITRLPHQSADWCATMCSLGDFLTH